MTRRLIAATSIAALATAGGWAIGPGAHAQPARDRAVATSPRFGHERHAAKGVAIDDCASCHALAADGAAAPPTSRTPHQPCAASGCHEAAFFTRGAPLCAVCHDEHDPSKKLVARYPARAAGARGEFGGQISHASHAGARIGGGAALVGAAGNGACVACHGDPYTRQPPAAGHAICGPCHGVAAPRVAPTPRMDACGGCHRRGAASRGAGATRSARSAWSVAATFDHADHAMDPRASGQAPACVECHTTVARAARTEQIAPPAMKTCNGCHDGAKAFKTTGFGCAKCHARAQPR